MTVFSNWPGIAVCRPWRSLSLLRLANSEPRISSQFGPQWIFSMRWPLISERGRAVGWCLRSEEHTSELQSLMRISYAVFCLKKKKKITYNDQNCETHTNYRWNTHEKTTQIITQQRNVCSLPHKTSQQI